MENDKKLSILIVDDEVNTRELYVEVFLAAGFDVTQAGDGLEALEFLQAPDAKHPDVIFSGLIMPRMDGFSLLEALKRNVATASIPLVFSSHLGRIEDKKRAEELGAAGFFVLGMISAGDVVAAIQALLLGGEYVVIIEPHSEDAARLAQDLDIPTSLVSNEGKYALKLKVKDFAKKTFEAELVVI
ncbi:MAG: response regulator [Candidatus Moraniibacteriota bacterium]